MTNEDSNPFKKLAADFAARQKENSSEKDQPGNARNAFAGPSFPRDAGRSRKEREGVPVEDIEDARLFLHAVTRIKPLRDKGKSSRQGHKGLAEAFAASMKSESSRKQASGRGDVGKGANGKALGDPPSPYGRAERTDVLLAGRDGAALPGFRTRHRNEEGFNTDREESFAELLDAPNKAAAPVSREEEAMFTKAMQGVSPVTSRGRDIVTPAEGSRTTPAVDPAKALRDVLEGRVEFALHHTDEYMEGFVVGVDPLVLARLRNGQYSPESHVDLHGMNARQAYEALIWFFKNAYQRGMRTVVVVTGRGRNSPDGVGVLRPLLQRWLCREPFKRVVLAFCTAKPGDGGPGAVYVLLRKYKKNRGKIIWEHTPSDDDFPDF